VTAVLLHAAAVPASELGDVAALLAEAGLPTDDLAEPGRRFWRFRDGLGDTVGVAGLEIDGTDALLRSVVVAPPRRRCGVGHDIVRRTLDFAAALGARRAFLLTTTAREFFAAQGFSPIERGAVPARIAATREFTTLCPASAACMVKALTPIS
jgi:N-acetylglutamate synthase-like GNAT family acetyltransferase